MTHPDGEVSFFNDSAIGIASNSYSLEKYAQKIDIQYQKNQLLICDGYFSFRNKNYHLVFDAAEIGSNSQPSHVHADTLSFELSIKNKRFFVNSGTSTYHDLVLRKMQRSTKAHNTLSINENNSSEVWGKFRVAKRAKIINRKCRSNKSGIYLTASHNGYKNISGRPIHKRTIIGNQNNIRIKDEIQSSEKNHISIYFYLHPDVVIEKENQSIYLLIDEVKVKITNDFPIEIINSFYYPYFNRKIVNKCLKVSMLDVANFENKFQIKVVDNQ
jgi:uncharacterized heparinase superfamily protein